MLNLIKITKNTQSQTILKSIHVKDQGDPTDQRRRGCGDHRLLRVYFKLLRTWKHLYGTLSALWEIEGRGTIGPEKRKCLVIVTKKKQY